MNESAVNLIRQLNETDEYKRIEAKSVREKLGDSAMETISAFANEPGLGGGYLLLGVARSDKGLFNDFEAVGVSNSEEIQTQLATRCRTDFNITVRPTISVETVKGEVVIVVFVPEATAHDKPVYLKKLGLPRGAYRRIGASDQHCTDEDLHTFFQGRPLESFDSNLTTASVSEANHDAVSEFRAKVAEEEPDSEAIKRSDEEFLWAIGAAKSDGLETRLTLGGLMMFGETSAIKRCMPMMRLDYIRTACNQWMKDAGDETDSTVLKGRIPDIIRRAHTLVLGDLPSRETIPEGTVARQQHSAIPARVIREAIVNSLMHRDYRTQGPVQIIRYPNRIEIRNPGYSLKAEDQYYLPSSIPRNPSISAFLHQLKIAETRGMGLGIMQQAMKSSGLYTPYFESNRTTNTFAAYLLFHSLESRSDGDWLRERGLAVLSEEDRHAMIFLREMGAINSRAYRSICGRDELDAGRSLKNLRDRGFIELRGATDVYYVMSDKVVTKHDAVVTSARKVGSDRTKSGKVGLTQLPNPADLEPFASPPAELQEKLNLLRKTAKPEVIRQLILELCGWKELMPMEVAHYLKRSSVKRLCESFVYPMTEDGLLTRTRPDVPTDPGQRYKTTGEGFQQIVFKND
jgi:ATP-dependent DNA helicase RecG